MMYLKKPTKYNIFGQSLSKTLLIFLLIILFGVALTFFSPIRSGLAYVFSPFLRAGNYVYELVINLPNSFKDEASLASANKELQEKLDNLRLNVLDFESLKFENKVLEENLGLKPKSKVTSGRVISKPPQVPLDTIFIDVGSIDKIKEGDLVLASERVLIGRVTKVFVNSSVVSLNSFADSVSPGFLLRTNESLELKGGGGGSMESQVPLEFDIKEEDEIMDNRATPHVLSIVRSIERDEASGFKKVLLSLPVDISKTRIIFVESVENISN